MNEKSYSIFAPVVGGLASGAGSGLLSYMTGRSSQEHAANLQYDNWKRMFDYEAAYNHPANQLRRSASVGVNPFVSPSGAQMVGLSSMNTGTPAAAPGAMPIDFSGSFNQVMQGLLHARESVGKDIENSKLGKWIDANILEKLKHAGYEEVMTHGQKLQNELVELYGKTHERAKISNLMKDTALKASQIMLNDDLSEEAASAALLNFAKEAHERALAVLGQKDIDAFDSRLNAWLDEVKSQVLANRAAAYRDTEIGKTENKMRESRYVEQVIKNGLAAIQFQNEEEFSHDDRQTALDYAIQSAQIQEKENNLVYWRFAVDVLRAVVEGAITATFAGKLLKAGKLGRAAALGNAKGKGKNNQITDEQYEEFKKAIKESDDFRAGYYNMSPAKRKKFEDWLSNSPQPYSE